MDSTLRSWLAAYDYLTLHIVPGPRSWMYFVPFVGTFAVLLVNPKTLSTNYIRYLIFPLLLGVQVADWYLHQSFDVISMNHVLSMFLYLGYYDVRRDFKRVIRDTDHGQKHLLQGYPDSFQDRLQWIGTLLVSLRLTDYHIGLASHDLRQPAALQPVRSFFFESIAHAVFSYGLLVYTRGNDFCRAGSDLTFLAKLYALLSLYNGLLPVILVLCLLIPLGLQHNSMLSPLTWQKHFGSFASVYGTHSVFGLRGFWGTFWHQNMRYLTSTPGIAVSSLLRLRGKQRYVLVVVLSFFLSGIVHMGVIPAEPFGSSALELRLRIAAFFWIQPFGIAFETVVLSKLKDKLAPLDMSSVTRMQQLQLLIWRAAIVSWTCGFLAVSAGQTLRPVGCTMGWWSSPWLS